MGGGEKMKRLYSTFLNSKTLKNKFISTENNAFANCIKKVYRKKVRVYRDGQVLVYFYGIDKKPTYKKLMPESVNILKKYLSGKKIDNYRIFWK